MIRSIMTEIGSGELIDKITILEIKADRISDLEKLKNVKHELSVLKCGIRRSFEWDRRT